jgi:hypothetical protein
MPHANEELVQIHIRITKGLVEKIEAERQYMGLSTTAATIRFIITRHFINKDLMDELKEPKGAIKAA